MKPASSVSGVIALLLCMAAPLAAQSPPACTRAEHRQFDFWLGEWNVTLPNGRAAGTNSIQSINAGGGLSEEWKGAGGSTGTSLNAFDPSSGRWHQRSDRRRSVLSIDSHDHIVERARLEFGWVRRWQSAPAYRSRRGPVPAAVHSTAGARTIRGDLDCIP